MYRPHQTARLLALALLVAIPAPLLADPAEDQYAVAAKHYSRARWELAAAEFETFLKDFSQDKRADTALFFLAESLIQVQQYAEAHQRFVDFLARSPQHPYALRARFRQGETAFLLGDYASAARELRAFGEQHPLDPLNAHALAYRGEIALRGEDGTTAVTVYRDLIKQFPDGPLKIEGRFGLARALEMTGDAAEALRFYEFLAQNASSDLVDNATLRAAILLYRLERHDEATGHLSKFHESLADSPLKPEAMYWQGTILLDSGKAAEAVEVFAKTTVASDHPIAAAVCYRWGEALRATGDAAQATVRYRQVHSGWPESEWADDALHRLIQYAFDNNDAESFAADVAAFQSQFADSPRLRDVSLLVGRAALREGRYGDAVTTLQTLSNDDVASADGTDRITRYYAAVGYLGAKRFAESLELLDSIEPLDDEIDLKVSIALARASALMALEQYAGAIDPLTLYLAIRPNGAEAADCLGKLVVCHGELDNMKQARTAFDELRARHTEAACFLPTAAYLADLAAATGHQELAGELYTLLSASGNSSEYVARGLAGLGRMQLEQGDTAASARTFERVLNEASKSDSAPKAALLRAESLEKSKHDEAAIGAYQLLIDRYPESSEAVVAMFNLAKLHDKLGQDREARDRLQALLAANPDFAQQDAVLYQLAWVFMDLGERENAHGTFNRLADGFPQSAYRQDSLYRLAELSYEDNDTREAARWLGELLQLDVGPHLLGHGLFLQGQVAAKDGRWADVAASMQRIVDDLPASSLRMAAMYWVAEAKYRLADYESAAMRFDELSELISEWDAPWVPMVPLRVAQLLAHEQKWSEALPVAKGIATRYPEFRQQYEVDYLIGRCLATQARFAEAREVFTSVTRSSTGGRTETAAMAQWMIGESFFHQKEYRAAIRAYHRVESLYAYPRWQAAALLQAGKCHEQLGEWKEAVKLYSQLLQEYPETTYAQEGARRLRVAQQGATSPSL